VKLVDAYGRVVASAPVDMARKADADGFVYATLTSAIVVQPGLYYLYSSETPGGDEWRDIGGRVSTTPDVTFLAGAYGRGLLTVGQAGTSYGPVTFSYELAGAASPWLQALTTATELRARSGGTLTFTLKVWAQAPEPVTGTVGLDLPAGWSAEPASFTVPTRGEPASVEVTVTVHVGEDASTGTYDLAVEAAAPGGLSSTRHVSVDVANLLYDFDDGTVQGWIGGTGVAGLSAVTHFPNGPGVPFQGTHALQLDSGNVVGPDSRTVRRSIATPVDLSAARTVYAYVDSYGAVPGATKYEATLTLRSGSDELTRTVEYAPNTWNRVEVDVGDWAGRSAVTAIEVAYQIHTTSTYHIYFHLDGVGWDS
jgi:hypothetical protein